MFTSRLNVLEHLVNVANKPKFIQLFGHIPKHALERIVFKESLVSVPRLINNTLIFLVLMLTALAIKLRWYAEVLSSSSQNWKTHPTISAKCSIQIKIILSSRFNMIWYSPEARGRNTARTSTQEQSSRLNCTMFRLCHGMRSRKMSLFSYYSSEGSRALFTQTRLLSTQFNYSLIRTWRRSKFLRNRKTTKRH